MKLMIINPDYGMTPTQINKRLSILKKSVGPDVRLDMECLSESRVTIDSMLDVALAAPEIIRMAIRAERQGYDAVILYCFSDPALEACREALDIPVIGAGQAAYLAATAVSRQFGVVVSGQARIPEKRMFAHQAGIDPLRVCSFGAPEPFRETREAIIWAGKRMIKRDGAQALVLGCLSFLGLADEVSSALGVPVIDSAKASVAMAEALVRMQLQTSKRAYPAPPEGTRALSAARVRIRSKQ